MSIIFLNSSLVKLAYSETPGVAGFCCCCSCCCCCWGGNGFIDLFHNAKILWNSFSNWTLLFSIEPNVFKKTDIIEVLNIHFTIFLQRNNWFHFMNSVFNIKITKIYSKPTIWAVLIFASLIRVKFR